MKDERVVCGGAKAQRDKYRLDRPKFIPKKLSNLDMGKLITLLEDTELDGNKENAANQIVALFQPLIKEAEKQEKGVE